MEKTRENRLAELRAKKHEKETLLQRDSELGQELNEIQNDTLVK